MDKRPDKRIKYVIVLDTETAPCDKDEQKVSPNNMLVYDVGWVVTDKRGKVYEKRSFINADIFLDEKDLMKSAYYANKIPQYWKQIKAGESELKSFKNIRKALCQDMWDYGIYDVFAHNMRFDLGSLNNTERWLTKSTYRYFFPYHTELNDTLKMARDVLSTMPTYRRFCEENGYMTNHKVPQPQMSAEVIYRYITQDTSFIEEHKGLDDVMIEKEIMAYLYRQHKHMRKGLFEK